MKVAFGLFVALCFALSTFAFYVPSVERSFSSLPSKSVGSSLNVGVVLPTDLIETDIGVFYLNLVDLLVENGHSVTIVSTEEPSALNVFQISQLFRKGVSFSVVPHDDDVEVEFTPEPAFRSYDLFTFLKEKDFDVVHVPDWKGFGYYSVLAKHQGLAFDSTQFVVGAQAPYMWSKLNNFERVHDTSALELDFMQKMSVELADFVITPSQFIANWMANAGWELPEQRTFVANNILDGVSPSPSEVMVMNEKPNEIVYFGDLEPASGLVLFCDAVDLIEADGNLDDLVITFLGAKGTVQGISAVDYISLRAKHWHLRYNIISNMDVQESVRYLSAGSRLAVIPPEQADVPLSVMAVLQAQLTFISSNVGGIPELIVPEDRDRALFAPRHDMLFRKIAQAVRNGAGQAPRASYSLASTKQAWMEFHNFLSASSSSSSAVVEEDVQPLVSVVMPTHNRPDLVRVAVQSIMDQDYPHVELVLVDDGSTNEAALATIEDLRPAFEARNWKIIQVENGYLGRARNIGVSHASGDFIMFMDDDNVAKSFEISTFVRVALRTGSDVLTAVEDYFYGRSDVPSDHDVPAKRRVPLGGDVSTGFFWNVFGDANMFVRKDFFLSIGGFSEDYAVGYEDYEFLAKSCLKGGKLEVVVEPLFWYRLTPSTMSSTTPMFKNRMRYIRPYMEAMPRGMSNMLIHSQTIYLGESETPRIINRATNCSVLTNCSACNAALTCGWCFGDMTCKPGDNSTRSLDGSCTLSTGWTYNTTCPSCSNLTKCKDCAENNECVWCTKDKKCVPGGSHGPWDNSTCTKQPGKFVFNKKSKCPSSSSSAKKKIAIIVGVSVAGGLIVLAALATGIFCFVRQQRSKTGYAPINES